MDYYNFFTNNNKSGYKCKENWLKKECPDLYDNIISNTNQDILFVEKIYLFINNLSESPKCPNCGRNVKFKGTLKKGYNNYCSITCLNKSEEHKLTVKKNNLKKYGTESHNSIKQVKEKKKQSYLKNFGVDNPMKNEKVKQKYLKSLKKNYGVDNPMKIPEIIENFKNSVFIGNEKNVKRVVDKLSNKYIFLKHDGKFYFKCKKCNGDFSISANLINSRLIWNKTICTNCNKLKSYDNLFNLLKDSFDDEIYEKNNRNILKKEMDIFFNQKNIGVEINGLYWHSEIFKDNYYHLNKTKLAEEKNIQLLHFFEDEIIYKTNIVKSIIGENLNKFNEKFHADLCEIHKIDNIEQIKEFLEQNHIQGFADSNYFIGLFRKNQLMSLMVFNEKNNNKHFEIIRFCNKLNSQIIGGTEKILRFFNENYKPKKITILLDRRYSNGSNFEKLGFVLNQKTKPNYYYIKPGILKRYSKIDGSNNYYKIFDCGNLDYSLVLE